MPHTSVCASSLDYAKPGEIYSFDYTNEKDYQTHRRLFRVEKVENRSVLGHDLDKDQTRRFTFGNAFNVRKVANANQKVFKAKELENDIFKNSSKVTGDLVASTYKALNQPDVVDAKYLSDLDLIVVTEKPKPRASLVINHSTVTFTNDKGETLQVWQGNSRDVVTLDINGKMSDSNITGLVMTLHNFYFG